MEAKLIALASVSEKANWLRDLLYEIPLWEKPIPPILIHFDSSVHLFPVNNDDEIFNQKDYASIIGSLRYATDCTRPNIAYAVGVLSRFTSKPSKDHWLAIE